jgi:hypothetical protein
MSDAPEGDDVTRGGKVKGDPALAGATETGGSSVAYSDTGSEADDSSTPDLPGEKGGGGGGGSGQGA